MYPIVFAPITYRPCRYAVTKFVLLAKTIRSQSLLSVQHTYSVLNTCLGCSPDINNINYG